MKCCKVTVSRKKVLRHLEILYFSQSALFKASGFFFFFSLFKHNSLNIGCCIKGVTNQADGEWCHTVSVLQGHRLSLRKPTSSALTSNSEGTLARAAARTCR